jgi:hypothetical protein
MADTPATGNKFLLFGDFSRYLIVDRVGLNVEVDPAPVRLQPAPDRPARPVRLLAQRREGPRRQRVPRAARRRLGKGGTTSWPRHDTTTRSAAASRPRRRSADRRCRRPDAAVAARPRRGPARATTRSRRAYKDAMLADSAQDEAKAKAKAVDESRERRRHAVGRRAEGGDRVSATTPKRGEKYLREKTAQSLGLRPRQLAAVCWCPRALLAGTSPVLPLRPQEQACRRPGTAPR